MATGGSHARVGALARAALVQDGEALLAEVAAVGTDVLGAEVRLVAEGSGEPAGPGAVAAVPVPPDATLRAHRSGGPPFDAEELGILMTMAGLVGLAGRRAGRGAPAGVTPSQGLPGRADLVERLRQALACDDAAPGSLALLVLDLDRFRYVNERLGHHEGTRVLASVAARLREAVAEGAFVAGLGSDVFAVLHEGAGGERAALATADALGQALARPVPDGPQTPVLTAGVGVCVADGHRSAAELLADAEAALRRAKRRGPGSVEIFEPAMRRRASERMALESDLRRAGEQRELRIDFQPIVSLADGRVTGFEALLRWDHPRRGTLHPAQFLDIADESGLLVPIGHWVLHEVTDRLAGWCADPTVQLGHVAVNLTRRQVADPALAGEVEHHLARTGVPAERLQLEVGEGVLMLEAGSPAAVLQDLRAVGVRLMLDDFGRGASSLGLLRRLPVDGMKIDGSLVRALEHDPRERHITGAIVAMGGALGLEVVGKGVESVGQAAALRALGCAFGQGYALGRPGTAQAATTLLRDGGSADHAAFGAIEAVPPARVAVPCASTGPDDGSLSLGQAAALLGVSPSTARRWADTGRLRGVRTSGGHRRFSRADVMRATTPSAADAA